MRLHIEEKSTATQCGAQDNPLLNVNKIKELTVPSSMGFSASAAVPEDLAAVSYLILWKYWMLFHNFLLREYNAREVLHVKLCYTTFNINNYIDV